MLRLLSVFLLGTQAQPGRYEFDCIEPWKIGRAARHTVNTLIKTEKHVTKTLLHLEGKMPNLAADMTKVLAILEKAEEHVTSTMEGFEDPRNADTCVTCPEVHRFVHHMTKHFLKFLDIDHDTKIDDIRPWKMEMIGVIGRIRSYAGKMCGPAHEGADMDGLLATSLMEDSCLAEDAVTMAITDVEGALKKGIADLEGMDLDGIFGDVVDKAVAILKMGETFVETEGAKIESMACPVCEKVSEMFDGLKEKIDDLMANVDMLPGWAKTFIDMAMKDVDAAFKTMCPTTWLLRLADSACLAQDEITEAIDVTDVAMKTAIKNLNALPDWLGSWKTMALGAVQDAEAALMKAGTELEGTVCADCQKVEDIFNTVKSSIDGIFADHPDVPDLVKEIVDTAMDVINKAFESQCASSLKLFTTLDDCMLETEVTAGVNMADAALKKVIADINALPLTGIVADLAAKVTAGIQDVDDKLMAAAPTIEGDACPTCEKMETMFENVKSMIDEHMSDAGLPQFLTDLVDGGLNKLDDVLQTQCPAARTELELGDTECALKDDMKVAFTAGGHFRAGALEAIKDLEDIPQLKGMATMGYAILSKFDEDIKNMEDEILEEACPACDAVKTKYEAVKTKVEGFLDMFDKSAKHPVKDAVEGLLDMLDTLLTSLCE